MPGPRTLLSATVCAVGVVLASVVPAAAAATTSTATAQPRGSLRAEQNTFTHRLRVDGYAYDSARPGASIDVRLYADGHYLGRAHAGGASVTYDHQHEISGKHAFELLVKRAATVKTVTLRGSGASSRAPVRTLAAVKPAHYQPTAAQRVIAVAEQYVGRARYREGGTSPRSGFDCSGYTRYVFAAAHAGSLPRTAEQQRRAGHAVSAHSARAGDLVFYGVPAYHVAIYAGHGMQYAATTERDGIRYQRVWASSVQYRRAG